MTTALQVFKEIRTRSKREFQLLMKENIKTYNTNKLISLPQ
jgi:hypothetical protein